MRYAHEARRAREYVHDVATEDGVAEVGRPAKRPLASIDGDLARTHAQADHLHVMPAEYAQGAPHAQAPSGYPIAHVVPREGRAWSPPGTAAPAADPALEMLARLVSSHVSEQEARACLRRVPLPKLLQIFKSGALNHGLPQLVPLLKVSDVLPCLQAPGMVELVLPCLDPSQCKLLGPEVVTLIAPYLHLNWTQLNHLPLETVVLVPIDTFFTLPLQVLKYLPDTHRHYVAPYVKGARKVKHDDHDVALCQGLCQILHLHAHKVLDPEHIPGAPQLRVLQRGGSLRAKIQELRWLVDAVMAASVEAVQIGSLKLTTLIVALRKVGLTGLAGELELAIKQNKQSRGWLHGADGVAYTPDRAIAVRHKRIDEDLFMDSRRSGDRRTARTVGPLADALANTFHQHAGLAAGRTGQGEQRPLPSDRYVPVISLELAAAYPPGTTSAWQALEAVLHEQLGEPRNGAAIQEVRLRWADGTTTVYCRHSNGRYLPPGLVCDAPDREAASRRRARGFSRARS